MIADAHVHQPGQVDAGAVDTLDYIYTVKLEEARAVQDIIMRTVEAKVDAKMERLLIVIQHVQFIAQLRMRSCGQ